jgi:propanol-preferring alcohol dehydrogenase
MVLTAPGPVSEDRLVLRDVAVPEPRAGEVRIRVLANAVCRTDLHIVEGELADPKPDLIPGHQIVGSVEALGEGVEDLRPGERIGVPWLGGVDGKCPYCRAGMENLCDQPTFTGYGRDGGYAEYAVARADFCLPLPEGYSDEQAAPLLCAGLIGYRALRLAEVKPLDAVARLGLFGFGSSAHIVIQVARHRGHEVYVVTRGERSRALARELGAVWVGGEEDGVPEGLDAVIIFAPVGRLVPLALGAVRKSGFVVASGIHMSPIPEFPYELLWGERVLRSVANLTRDDGREFLALAPDVPVKTEVTTFPLERANEALRTVKAGGASGAVVVVP